MEKPNSFNNFLKDQIDTISSGTQKDISTLLYNNYGDKSIVQLQKFFDILSKYISLRNIKILDVLKQHTHIPTFDLSGGIILNSNIQDYYNKYSHIKNFLHKNYTYNGHDSIHSRGYGYYFNFSGFEKDRTYKHSINSEYFDNLNNYIIDIQMLCEDVNQVLIDNDIPTTEKKNIYLFACDHLKNIGLFLENLLSIFSNENHFIRDILDVPEKKFSQYFVNLPYIDINLLKQIKEFNTQNVHNYNNCLLSDIYNPFQSLSNEYIGYIDHIHHFFTDSFEKQDNMIEKFSDIKNEKSTDIDGIKEYLRKINNRAIIKCIRPIREQDNPLKQLLSCYLLSKRIPDDTKKCHINSILYGGIEMQYMMDRVISTLYPNITIQKQSILLSYYHLRNAKHIGSKSNYSIITDNEDINPNYNTLQIILDDNIFNGGTIDHANNILAHEGPILYGVAEVGLRRHREKLVDLLQSNKVPLITNLAATCGATTPLSKRTPFYRNLVNYKILDKLPCLVGKVG